MKKIMTAGAALGIGVAVFSSPITRMDIYDSADNHLLFVTFDYNGSGDCVGRSVFASDSTFLRSVTIQPGGTAAATKENSLDFNGNPLFATTINPPSAGKTSFSTLDQFGLSQFGSPLSYAEPAANTFDVTQSGATLIKEQYEFDGSGDLTRITVLDKSGALGWYAVVAHEKSGVQSANRVPRTPSVRLASDRGKIRLFVHLFAAGVVRAELYTPAGRKALSIVNKMTPAGSRCYTADGLLLGNGTYLAKVTVNGVVSLTRMIAIQK